MHQSLSAKYLINRFNVNVENETVLSPARLGGKTESVIPPFVLGDCRKNVLRCGSFNVRRE